MMVEFSVEAELLSGMAEPLSVETEPLSVEAEHSLEEKAAACMVLATGELCEAPEGKSYWCWHHESCVTHLKEKAAGVGITRVV